MKTNYIIIKDNIIKKRIVCESSKIDAILNSGETAKEFSQCRGSLNVGNKYLPEEDLFISPFKFLSTNSPISIYQSTGSVNFSYMFSHPLSSFDDSIIPDISEGTISDVVIENTLLIGNFTPSSPSSSFILTLDQGNINSVYEGSIDAGSLPSIEFVEGDEIIIE